LEYIEDVYHKVHVFYDIPYDTGAGRQLKFDLEEFCRHFKLQRQAVYYSLVYIERTGHWTLSEDVDISTKVQVMVDRNDLYDLDLPDPDMVRLLEILMRRYTGLFSYPVPIDEEYVAGQIGVGVPMFRQFLYRLSLEHVIRYVPCDHATVLYLHHERLRPKNVNLDPERYELLKASALKRVQKMIDYISEESVCRSSYLLEYFGQTENKYCGTCDICRSGRVRDRKPEVAATELSCFINDDMSGRYTLEDVEKRFGSATSASSDSYLSILRDLIDSGAVPAPSAD
jgi:ATP-dependent DNA helicase RecQ